MTRTGADLSHHQAAFDAARYFAAEDFLVHKATEDGGYTDPTFTGRWRAAAGHPRAAYHFARPGSATVDAQADHFLRVVRAAGWQPGDAWALDLEDAGGLGPAQLVAWADRWCGRVRAALGGRGLFYTGVSFVFDALGDPGRIPGGCLGWIARYRTDSPWAAPYRRPGGWPEVPDFWQCTNGDVGCVHQVASVGACDWNKATDAAFAALFGGQEEGTFMALTDAQQQELLAAARQINGAVGAGQTSYQGTVEATLATVQSLVNLLKAAQGAIAGQVADTRSAVLGAVYALPAPETPEQAAAARDQILDVLAHLGVEGVSPDALLDALYHRLET